MKVNDSQVQAVKKWLGAGSINLFGLPFAGKDTQARQLAEIFDGVVLGGGDILRNSVIPDHVKAAMATGALIPTKDYLEIVLPYLSQEKFAGKPLILSSVGRWHGEEAGVLEATAAAGHPLRGVIYLNAGEELIWKRSRSPKSLAERGERPDHDKLKTRLKEFKNKTLSVIDFYRDEGLLVEVDGSLSSGEVTAEILSKLCSFGDLLES